MLFSYKYVSHDIEKFQRYLDFIFIHVWCKAKGEFSSSKLRGYPELKKIYEVLHYDEGKWAQFFNSHIELIYQDFLVLDKSQRKKIKKWYKINNRIPSLYANKNLKPVTYSTLNKRFPDLGKNLKSFYSKLYGNESPFILVAFGNIKKIKAQHYKKFIDVNFDGHEGICPFCGLNSIKGNDHTKLEAYDHFLPQGSYPFNVVNFKNLAPMCHECNSSYKLEQSPLMNIDPLTKSERRRKAFFPYSKKKWEIDVKINLTNRDIKTLKQDEINISISSNNRLDHIDSWLEVFGIEERYKAKLLAKHAGKKWYSDIKDGIHNARKILNKPDMTAEQWTTLKLNECNGDLLAECNFLKKPFYEECIRISII